MKKNSVSGCMEFKTKVFQNIFLDFKNCALPTTSKYV